MKPKLFRPDTASATALCAYRVNHQRLLADILYCVAAPLPYMPYMPSILFTARRREGRTHPQPRAAAPKDRVRTGQSAIRAYAQWRDIA